MRIAIFGAGSVGGYFGGRLAHAGKDVVFIARGDHLKAMQSGGLKVDSVAGDFHVARVDATDDPAVAGPVDVVIVAVKAWQVRETAEALRPMLGPDTLVLPVQNGVEAPGQLAAVLGDGRVLAGLCAVVSRVAGAGHIKHEAVPEPSLSFKEMNNTASNRVDALRQALECDGFEARVPEDIHAAMWSKLIGVSPGGAVGGVTRTPGLYWRDVPEARSMYEEAAREVFDVAKSRGIALEEQLLSDLADWINSMPVTSMMSMQRDILAGRPSELEAQVGVVHRLGVEAGVLTPVYTSVYRSLLLSEMKARGQIDFAG